MKSRIIFYYSFFLVYVVMTGCRPTKTKLSEAELRWVNVYKAGDTLIFKSGNGKCDTSYIIRRSVYYPEYIPLEVHDKYLPEEAVVVYKNRNLEYHPDSSELIHISKEHPNGQTRLFIDYLYSKVIIPDITIGEIKKYKKGKVYEFDTYHPKSKPSEPRKIFWHEDYGIVKYITHNNEVWMRINLPKKWNSNFY